MEFCLGLSGQAAASRFGGVAVVPAIIVVLSPPLVIGLLERRSARATLPALATTHPVLDDARSVGTIPDPIGREILSDAQDKPTAGENSGLSTRVLISPITLYEGSPSLDLYSAFVRPCLALLEVTNDSQATVRELVSQVRWESAEREVIQGRGVWSKLAGPIFILGGGHKATITPGDSVLLAVALAYEAEERWATWSYGKLPEKPSGRTLSIEYFGTVLGESGGITVTLNAEGIKKTEHVRLGFHMEKAVAAHDPSQNNPQTDSSLQVRQVSGDAVAALQVAFHQCKVSLWFVVDYLGSRLHGLVPSSLIELRGRRAFRRAYEPDRRRVQKESTEICSNTKHHRGMPGRSIPTF